MKVATLSRVGDGDWQLHGLPVDEPQFVLWFAAPEPGGLAEAYDGLRRRFPRAVIVGCTTSGEICNGEVLDGSAVAAAIRLEAARIEVAEETADAADDLLLLGRRLGTALPAEGLRLVYLLVDGPVTAGQVIDGLIAALPPGVPVTGGVAGASDMAVPTGTGANTAPTPGRSVAIGFYGEALRLGYGSGSGWDPLGPARRVTRASRNVIYELDGQPALDLYLRFIGETPAGARLNALRYPFVFKASADAAQDVIRTLHSVDEETRSLTFVDEVPQGYIAQMMRSVPDHMVDGGIQAARRALAKHDGAAALALVVSCIGRKWVMGQTVSDEVAAIQDELGSIPSVGFFSFGEICPHERSDRCTLYNESVTLTLIGEAT